MSTMATRAMQTSVGTGSATQQTTIKQSDLRQDEPYHIKTPIPVTVTRDDAVDFTASFNEARIAISGENFQDALDALVNEILDVFDYLSEHRAELGVEPQRQLAVLCRYIARLTTSHAGG